MDNTHTQWAGWKTKFRCRAGRPVPSLHSDLDYTQLPRSLARSLAIFQLGESGGGSLVEQARRASIAGIDQDYADALALFVAEEHRHASILAVWVRLLGGELIRENWTAKLFVLGRRLMGLRFKVMVLLAAEIVGLCYYRLLASRLPPCRMRDWLLDIVADENDHLEFHCQFLRAQVKGPLSRCVFKAVWRALMFVSELVVLTDHRRALKDMAIGRDEVRRLWAMHSRVAELRIVAASDGWQPASGPVVL